MVVKTNNNEKPCNFYFKNVKTKYNRYEEITSTWKWGEKEYTIGEAIFDMGLQ